MFSILKYVCFVMIIWWCYAVCVLQKGNGDALALAVWMANSSELLHFFSCDADIAGLSVEAHNVLAECVQRAFMLLVDTLQNRLQQTMPAFISTNPDVDTAGKRLCYNCWNAFCQHSSDAWADRGAVAWSMADSTFDYITLHSDIV